MDGRCMSRNAFDKARPLAALMVATAIAVAACSSTGNKTASGGDSTKTVTLGLLTSLTGPLSAVFGQATVAATQARIALANDKHEIPGVTLKLVVQDDQSTPAGALAATQVLVNQDHVFAL